MRQPRGEDNLHDIRLGGSRYTPVEKLAATILLLAMKDAAGRIEPTGGDFTQSTKDRIQRKAKRFLANEDCRWYSRMLARFGDPDEMQAALVQLYGFKRRNRDAT